MPRPLRALLALSLVSLAAGRAAAAEPADTMVAAARAPSPPRAPAAPSATDGEPGAAATPSAPPAPPPAEAPAHAPPSPAPAAATEAPPAARSTAAPPTPPTPSPAELLEPDFDAPDDTARLEAEVQELRRRSAALSSEVTGLRRRVDHVEDESGHRTFGLGVGAVVPLGAPGRARLSVEANLRYLFACYYAGGGAGVGLHSTIEVWRVRIRLLGVGVFFTNGAPMDLTELQRAWDLLVTSGLDIRVWKGLELRAQVAWFLPDPTVVAGQAAARATQAGLDVAAQKDNLAQVGETYKLAALSPSIDVGVRWEF